MKTQITIDPARLEKFNTIMLKHGGHKDDVNNGGCAMEWAAFLAGEEHSDRPMCVDPVITSAMIALNDRLNDEDRQLLKPYIAKTLGTRGSAALSEKRRYIAIDFAVRKFSPVWFELANMGDEAERLRKLPQVSAENVEEVRAITRALREKHGSASWWTWRGAFYNATYKAVYKKVLAELKEGKTATATATATAADADAAADAAAAAATAADAAADAATDAAMPAYGTDAYWAWRDELAAKVRKNVRARLDEAWGPTLKRLLPLALEMIDAMIAAEEPVQE